MLRIGIIGAGHFAERHVEAVARLSERARIVKAARRDPDKPFAALESADAEIVTLDQLLASPDVDAVIVCSPNNLHRAHAEAALRAGKHVFCEKPLALSTADADAAIATANETGKVLMVGHLTRHMPQYRAVADVLASRRLGTPWAASASRLQRGGDAESWRMIPEIGGGAPFDLLIHDLDLLNWYMGPPERIVARGRLHRQGAFDHVAVVLTYPGGEVATADSSFLLRAGGLTALLRVICEHGYVEADNVDPEYPVRVYETDRPVERIAVDTGNARLDGVISELNEFFDAIEGKPQGRLTLSDARLNVACAEAVVRSAETDAEVALG
jgi:predicted dehydrogenase